MAPGGLKKDHAELIIAQYEELAGKLEKFDLMPQGLFNENARLSVAGNSYVLKKMTAGRSLDRHRYGARLQNILSGQGYPCPRVICNREDDEISSYEGNLWSVQTWADGVSCVPGAHSGPGGLQLRKEIGSALGTFHSLSRGALEQGFLAPAPDEARLNFSEMISRVEAEYNRLFRHSLRGLSQVSRLKLLPGKSSSRKEALEYMTDLKTGCRCLLNTKFSEYPSLNILGPCHGDINWENLFFQDGKLTAVLDFDNAMEMNQTYDAAAAAAVVCADDSKYLEVFLDAYEEKNGAPVERKIFPRLMLLKNVRSLLFQVNQVLAGGTGNDEMARKWRNFLADNIRTLTSEYAG